MFEKIYKDEMVSKMQSIGIKVWCEGAVWYAGYDALNAQAITRDAAGDKFWELLRDTIENMPLGQVDGYLKNLMREYGYTKSSQQIL